MFASRGITSLLLICAFLFAQPHKAFAEEEGGSKAAEILFGLAAIMAAVSPMVAAAVQANADQNIAKINANAQMTMTKMSTDTSKFMADQQKNIALTQAGISADISKQNQDSATKRLEMQLSELRIARQESNAVDEKKRAYQQQLDEQRIQLAKDQAAETVRLANVQLRAQLTQAGMSQGYTRAQGVAGSVATPNRPLVSATSATGASTATAGTNTFASNSPTASNSGLGIVSSSVGNRVGGETAAKRGVGSSSTASSARGVTGANEESSSGFEGGAFTSTPPVGTASVGGAAAPVLEEKDLIAKFEGTLVEGKKKTVPAKRGASRGIASVK